MGSIIGIGVDLCLVEPIRASIRRFGNPWLNKIFTQSEQVACWQCDDAEVQFARLFAVKEACAKALGTGFDDGVLATHFDVTLIDDEILVSFHYGALEHANRLAPSGMSVQVTSEKDIHNRRVMAFVILQKTEPSL